MLRIDGGAGGEAPAFDDGPGGSPVATLAACTAVVWKARGEVLSRALELAPHLDDDELAGLRAAYER